MSPPGDRSPNTNTNSTTNTITRILAALTLLVVLAPVVAVTLSGCRRAERSTVGTSANAAPANAAHGSAANGHGATAAVAWAGYIDDAECADCHGEIAESYARHPMGQSMRANSGELEWPTRASNRNPFLAGRFEYSVAGTSSGLQHRQQRRDANDQVVTDVTVQPVAVVGSGQHGQSFLVDRERYLFMSPITWYPERQVWDLSPGYERRDSEFHRPVVAECLFCHANQVVADPGPLNRFNDIQRVHQSIGCQRCHGPGAQHVAERRVSPPDALGDSTIVHPGRLDPKRREAVCQQCHLSGLVRLTRPGQTWSDFRPGEPLESTIVAYGNASSIGSSTSDAATRFVGHVEQMLVSRCYVGSAGLMGCTSCHDPHEVPAPAQRAEHFRDRCGACHVPESPTDCELAASDARRAAAANDCTACHMPKRSNQVRHTAITDHRILRIPEESTGGRPIPPLGLNASALQAIVIQPDARPESQRRRDQAVAMVMAQGERPGMFDRRALRDAARWLERALQIKPDDVDALLALGQIQLELNELPSARETFRRAVVMRPDMELAWVWAARTLGAEERLDEAASSWRRAIGINPYQPNSWYELGLIYGRQGQWAECRRWMLRAAERFPTSMGARQLLVESYLRLGERAEAEAAFEFMRRFRPAGFDRVEAWYRDRQREMAESK